MKPILIYSGGGNPRFYKIAIETGYKYGARLPDTIYGPLFFADQNWKNPNRESYMSCLKKYRPIMATVLDLEKRSQFNEVMDWTEEASQYVDIIQIIPKIKGIISKLPKKINGKDIILGYSVPSKYGRTEVSLEEYYNWNIHLLGGSPQRQFEIWMKLKNKSCIYSADGNYCRMKATRFCEYFGMDFKWHPDCNENEIDVPYIVFKKSCENIIKLWQNII
jgi:hypothetical protein